MPGSENLESEIGSSTIFRILAQNQFDDLRASPSCNCRFFYSHRWDPASHATRPAVPDCCTSLATNTISVHSVQLLRSPFNHQTYCGEGPISHPRHARASRARIFKSQLPAIILTAIYIIFHMPK